MSKKNKKVWLTYDDGPVADQHEKLALLGERGVPATWFCTGENLEKLPGQALAILEAGHVIANHSWNHPGFSSLTLAQARDQIERTEEQIESVYRAAGQVRPKRLFRFPYLDIGASAGPKATMEQLQTLLAELGFEPGPHEGITYEWWSATGRDKVLDVGASFDTRDWAIGDPGTSEYATSLEGVLEGIRSTIPEQRCGYPLPDSNEIVLLHAWLPMAHFRPILESLTAYDYEFLLP